MTPAQNNFITQLKFARAGMTKAQRRRTRNRVVRPMQYPIGIEVLYYKGIKNITSLFIDQCKPLVDKYINAYFVRKDSAEDDLEALIEEATRQLLFVYGTTLTSSGTFGNLLASIAEKVLGANSKYFQKQLNIVSGGVSIFVDTPWWNGVKSLWEQQNYKLIKNLGEEYITKINNTIISGLQNGLDKASLIESISKIEASLTGNRSYVIARDQVGKLNSLVTKEQSMYIGMETYFWQTARDERVRGDPKGRYSKAIPSHYDMEGLLFTWKNSAVYSEDLGVTWLPKTARMEPLHAGMAILCRCIAQASWNQYIANNIDRTLGDAV